MSDDSTNTGSEQRKPASPRDINLALCKVLGIDPANTKGVIVSISPDDFPQVIVKSWLRDEPREVLQVFRLVDGETIGPDELPAGAGPVDVTNLSSTARTYAPAPSLWQRICTKVRDWFLSLPFRGSDRIVVSIKTTDGDYNETGGGGSKVGCAIVPDRA